MDFNFTVRFGKSVVPEYEKALEYASNFTKFTPAETSNTSNTIETNYPEVLEKYQVFMELLSLISSWESARIQYRDKELSPIVLKTNIKRITECFFERSQAVNKEAYCNELTSCWGCRLLDGIVHNHTEVEYNDYTKYWYQYGAFTAKTTWRVDKEEISKALIDIIEKKNLEFCPAFQHVFFRKILAALPSKIDVSETNNWGLEFLDTSITNVKRWEPVNVFHKSLVNSTPKESHTARKTKKQVDSTENDNKADNINLRYIPHTNFKDVGGIEDILQNIREVVELPLIKPELFHHLGITPYRGILLWGEPGNGKTLIAKAIAHEVNAHFIPIAGPDILNKSFGESEKNLREIFEEARDLQPSIIFIDEIDSIAQSRLAGEATKWYATVVNQLLALMDGIREFGNVTVLASTNRPDLLDPALLRPGRFDYKLEVRRPNLHGCKTILEIASRDMPLASDVDLFPLAEAVMGYSAAEITFVAREAAMSALRRTIDIKAVLRDESTLVDYSNLEVKQSDFFNALMIVKWHSKYVNKTYSLK